MEVRLAAAGEVVVDEGMVVEAEARMRRCSCLTAWMGAKAAAVVRVEVARRRRRTCPAARPVAAEGGAAG